MIDSAAERERTLAWLTREHEHIVGVTFLGVVATELYSSSLGLVVLGSNEEFLAHKLPDFFQAGGLCRDVAVGWDGVRKERVVDGVNTIPHHIFSCFERAAALIPRGLP